MAFQELKCVAFDLDGTLLNASSQLSARTEHMLHALHEKNIPVVIASGRPFSTIPEKLLQLPAVRYVVTGNGVCIYDTAKQETVLRRSLSPQALLAVIEKTKYYPLAYEFFIDGKAYANESYVRHPEQYGLHEKACQYIQRTRIPVADVDIFVNTHQHVIDSMGLSLQDMTLKTQLWHRLEQEIEDIYVTSSLPRLLEIADHRAGKGAALEVVLSYLSLSQEGLMAFGDADNDKGMLELAGMGVAMGNAEDTLKAVADRITLHHDEDGVANIVEEYLEMSR